MADLGTLGGAGSRGLAINDHDAVVGSSRLGYPQLISPPDTFGREAEHAFLWQQGQLLDLSPDENGWSTAVDVAANGDVLIQRVSAFAGTANSWLFSKGCCLPICADFQGQVRANGINARGQVVGELAGGLAFLWCSERYEILQAPGANSTTALDLNDHGDLVGYFRDGAKEGAFLRTAEGEFSLEMGRADYHHAAAINNHRQILVNTGASGDMGSHPMGWYLWSEGVMVSIQNLIPKHSGWQVVEVTDINDGGQIVGNGEFRGSIRAFVLSP